MNKKTVSKVNLFFGGLVSRMEENKDFFNDITINLKSGTKNFPAKILYTDDITFDYQANLSQVRDLRHTLCPSAQRSSYLSLS